MRRSNARKHTTHRGTHTTYSVQQQSEALLANEPERLTRVSGSNRHGMKSAVRKVLQARQREHAERMAGA